MSFSRHEVEVDDNTTKPNWLELPTNLTMNILQRLGAIEILTSARKVCPYWWKICKNPLVWSTIHMIGHTSRLPYDFAYICRFEKICQYVVNRSCGHLKDIYLKKYGTDFLLKYIASSACQLKRIQLEECTEISNKVFIEFVKTQPLLEELNISHCLYQGNGLLESVGQCCPLLKWLKFKPFYIGNNECDDVALAIAKTMPGLQHLNIMENQLTNDGLLAILDGCPLLESLDLRECVHLDLSGSLGKRCKDQIKELRYQTKSVDHNFLCYEYDDYDLVY